MGSTLRKTYDVSLHISRSKSAENCQIGSMLSCNRRTARRAFIAFVSTLVVLSGVNLCELFKCETCETKHLDRTNRIAGIVLDGTATGLLGELPSYECKNFQVFATTDCSKHQFIVQESTHISFLNKSIFSSPAVFQ